MRRMIQAGLVVLTSVMAGCATCREHPVQCAVTVVVVGAIAAHEIDRRRDRGPRTGQQTPPGQCPGPTPESCR